jgi:hypothetical protein
VTDGVGGGELIPEEGQEDTVIVEARAEAPEGSRNGELRSNGGWRARGEGSKGRGDHGELVAEGAHEGVGMSLGEGCGEVFGVGGGKAVEETRREQWGMPTDA